MSGWDVLSASIVFMGAALSVRNYLRTRRGK